MLNIGVIYKDSVLRLIASERVYVNEVIKYADLVSIDVYNVERVGTI